MFYEHVSRQSTVDTSKHRRGRHRLLQQMYFSLHHMSSHVVDFCPERYTIASLLHFISLASLLSFPPVHTCYEPQTPLCTPEQTSGPSPVARKRRHHGVRGSLGTSSAPWAPEPGRRQGFIKYTKMIHVCMQIFILCM